MILRIKTKTTFELLKELDKSMTPPNILNISISMVILQLLWKYFKISFYGTVIMITIFFIIYAIYYEDSIHLSSVIRNELKLRSNEK